MSVGILDSYESLKIFDLSIKLIKLLENAKINYIIFNLNDAYVWYFKKSN